MDDRSTLVLLSDLNSPDKRAVRAAVDQLIQAAAAAPELARKLNRLLEDSTGKSAWPAAYVLAQLPSPSPRVFEVLMNALDHPDADIRWAVMLLLVRLAKSDRAIMSRLLELRKSGTPSQRRMALYAIRDLNANDSTSLAGLLDSLRDADPTVRVAAVTSLKERLDIDSMGRKMLFEIFVNDPDLRARNAAAVTLARLGTPTEDFLAALERAGESEHAQLKKAAAAALAILKR